MRGMIRKRYKGSWSLVIDLGYQTDPATGLRKRKQKWVTFHGPRKGPGGAEAKLTELVRAAGRGEFVEPTRLTLVEYLRDWLEKCIKPPVRRPATYELYRNVIERHVAKAPLALLPLQRVRAADLERYYAELPVSAATVTVHHAVLHRALRKAVKDRLLVTNPAADVEARPRSSKDPGIGAREHAWTAAEARAFLVAADAEGPQTAAFYALALDTGARRNELLGLGWEHLDFERGTVTFARQLTGPAPEFGPTKNGHTRTIALGAETLTRLRAHKRQQAALKLRNRTTYLDVGLAFAKEPGDLQSPQHQLGQPLPALAKSRYARLVATAGVRPIKFHGLRHTCATLLLQAGRPAHVVAKRLGHERVEVTLNVYAHVLPDDQAAASDTLGALLFG